MTVSGQYTLNYESDKQSNGELILQGVVDFENASDILTKGEYLLTEAGLLSAGNSATRQVTINVSQVATVQSVLLSLLLRWLELLQAHGNVVNISGLSEKMLKVAKVTGLESILPVSN
jgi:anti-anti-sigma factor